MQTGGAHPLTPSHHLCARLRARMTGLHHLARFEVADLWKTDLSPYRTVVIFGVDGMVSPPRCGCIGDSGGSSVGPELQRREP